MKRQKKNFKLGITVVAILLSIAFLPEAAWAGDWDKISSSLKSTAVGAVGMVLPRRYVEKPNNTNVIQTIKSTAGGVVGKLAGPEAGNTVATGRWMNVLTPSGAMTAGKIIISSAAGALALDSNRGRNLFTANWTQNLLDFFNHPMNLSIRRKISYPGYGGDTSHLYTNQHKIETKIIPVTGNNTITGNNITTLNEKSWGRR